MRSKWGDESLYFKHQLWEYDFAFIKNNEDPEISGAIRTWRNARPPFDQSEAFPMDDDGYTIANIPQLPVDNAEAGKMIQDDIASGTCPFAWILRANS